MTVKLSSKLIVTLALVAGGLAPAQASSPFSGVKALLQQDVQFQSRTCGLVLLSHGRAQVRAEKAQGGAAFGPAQTQLTKAFLLLRDGREVSAGHAAPRTFFNEHLSTGETTTPRYQALPDAVMYCENWFGSRSAKPNFDASAEAQASAATQAQMTLDSE